MSDKSNLELSQSTLAHPHSIDIESILQQLDTSFEGLTEEEASHRLQTYGPNELVKGKKHPLWLSFIKQFKNYLTIILLVATAFSLLIGEISDALIILAIVVAAASLSFFEEYRSDKSIEALQRMTAPTATIRRKGTEKMIRTADVVPGDILVLHMGDKVAADARVIESVNLRSDESPLTGESVPVSKSTEPLPQGLELADRTNMVHMGTVVVYGRGTVVVIATGMRTEFGKIAGSLEEQETKTPLEERLAPTAGIADRGVGGYRSAAHRRRAIPHEGRDLKVLIRLEVLERSGNLLLAGGAYHGLFGGKSGGDKSQADFVAHVRVQDDAKDNVGIGIDGLLDNLGRRVDLEQGQGGTAGDVKQDAGSAVHRDIQHRAGEGLLGGIGGPVRAGAMTDGHPGRSRILHDCLDVRKVEVDETGYGNDLGY